MCAISWCSVYTYPLDRFLAHHWSQSSGIQLSVPICSYYDVQRLTLNCQSREETMAGSWHPITQGICNLNWGNSRFPPRFSFALSLCLQRYYLLELPFLTWPGAVFANRHPIRQRFTAAVGFYSEIVPIRGIVTSVRLSAPGFTKPRLHIMRPPWCVLAVRLTDAFHSAICQPLPQSRTLALSY